MLGHAGTPSALPSAGRHRAGRPGGSKRSADMRAAWLAWPGLGAGRSAAREAAPEVTTHRAEPKARMLRPQACRGAPGRPRGGGAAECCSLTCPQAEEASVLRAGAGRRRAGRPGGGDRALPQGARPAAGGHIHGRDAHGCAARGRRDGGPRRAVGFVGAEMLTAQRGGRDRGTRGAVGLAPSRRPAAPLRAASQAVLGAMLVGGGRVCCALQRDVQSNV
jgi:hypothetical protein